MSNFCIGMAESATIVSGPSTSAAAGTAASYVLSEEPGLVYRSNSTATSFVFRFDLGQARNIGMVGLFGLPTTISSGPAVGEFLVQGTSDATFATFGYTPGGWTTLKLSSNRTADYAKGLFIETSRPSYRYWQVSFAFSSVQTLELSRIALCDLLQPVDNVEWGLTFEIDDTSKVDSSPTGYDDVELQRILPVMTGKIPWGNISEEPRMRQLIYRAGTSREVVACLDPADTTWGEDKTIWGRLRTGLALHLADYDINELEFSVRSIMP